MHALTDIVTDRLIVRNVTRADTQAVYDIWKNEENEEYMSDPVNSLKEVAAICAEHEDHISFQDGLLRVAVLKSTGEVIGTCCFGQTSLETEWGFGYSIQKAYWGQGYATELLQGILDFGIACGVTDFESSCATENPASARVMQKCGMVFHHKTAFHQPDLDVTYEEDVYRYHVE